jgi:hypothetical protein
MKKLLLGVAAFLIAALPCLADVIPTRRVERNATAEQKVKARLEQLGVAPQEADRQVSDLSVDRVQAAAGLYWYEWLGGLAFIAIITAVILIRVYG